MTESSLTMNRWWHRHRRSPLCLSLYAVCFVIVLSFILFEVLDVDGSDFQVPTGRNATLRATTAEEHADILRRAPLINAVAPLLLIGLIALVTSSATPARSRPGCARIPAPRTPRKSSARPPRSTP